MFVEELEEQREEVHARKTEISRLQKQLSQAQSEISDKDEALRALQVGRREELEETVVNLEQDLLRMNQENNTQRLQMQRMQSQLRKVQGKGSAEADRDLGFLRTQVHGQQVSAPCADSSQPFSSAELRTVLKSSARQDSFQHAQRGLGILR
jgi:chromosome segregation ATPase